MIADYFEALTGYRAWSYISNGVLLGVSHSQPWPTYQPLVAACNDGHGAHLRQSGAWMEAPVMECSCGIYCYKENPYADLNPKGAADYYFFGDPVVWGSVKIWGRVIEHEGGYRAQYAYPHELYTSASEHLATRLQKIYGVPCTYVKPEETTDNDLMISPQSLALLGQIFNYSLPRHLGTVRGISSPATFKFWRNNANPAPPAPPPVIHTPTFAQIRTIGASRYQQQMEARGRRGGKSIEWRAILRKMVFLNPDPNT